MKDRDDDQPKTTMFRGEAAHVWQKRFEQQGYPPEKAALMAKFLTVKGTPPPKWEDLVK